MRVNERNYIIWQNRSFRFYLASRLLHFNKLIGPCVFCGQQSLELLLKATLIYCDKSFQPKEAGHKIEKMLRTLKNKVKAEHIKIPNYFYSEQRYQSIHRYPKERKLILKPARFLEDLDKWFKDLIILVPFQFNSELINMFKGDKKEKTF